MPKDKSKDPGRTLKDRKKQLEDAMEGDVWDTLEEPEPKPTPKPKQDYGRSRSLIKWR